MTRSNMWVLGTLLLGSLAIVRCGGDDSTGGGAGSSNTGGNSAGTGGRAGTGGGSSAGTGGSSAGTGGASAGTGGSSSGTGGSQGTGGGSASDASATGTGGRAGTGGSTGTGGRPEGGGAGAPGTGGSNGTGGTTNNNPFCPASQPTDGTTCTPPPADAGAGACQYTAPVDGGIDTTTCNCALAAELNDAGGVVRDDAGAIVRVRQWNCNTVLVRDTCPANPVANNGICNGFTQGLVCPGVGGRTCTCEVPVAAGDAGGGGGARRWNCVLPPTDAAGAGG